MSKTERVVKELSDLRSFYIRLKKRKQPTESQTPSNMSGTQYTEAHTDIVQAQAKTKPEQALKS